MPGNQRSEQLPLQVAGCDEPTDGLHARLEAGNCGHLTFTGVGNTRRQTRRTGSAHAFATDHCVVKQAASSDDNGDPTYPKPHGCSLIGTATVGPSLAGMDSRCSEAARKPTA